MKTLFAFFYTGVLLALLGACSKEESADHTAALTIASFYPNSGKGSTLVTFEGSGFNGNYEQNSVSFNGAPAEVLSVTDSTLVVLAPNNGTSGTVTIAVGSTTVEAGTFTYQDLSVTSVSPSRTASYEVVHIKGYGFKGSNFPVVTFDDAEAKVLFVSDTLLSVTVPGDLSSTATIKVAVDDQSATGPSLEIVRVLDYSPKIGIAGMEITVIGNGFSPDVDGNRVFYGEAELQVVDASDDKVIAVIPKGLTTASATISIQPPGFYQPIKTVNLENFTLLLPPTITTLTPVNPGAGDRLTIDGTNLLTQLDGYSTQVFVGSTELSGLITSNSATRIRVSPLPGGISGPVKVVVNNQAVEGATITIP